MNGRSLTMQTAAALTGLMLSALVADAAEVKVFTSVALTNALDELAPIFEQKTGNKLTISYDLAAVQKKRILDGERADVIILTRVMMDDLAKQNKLAPGNIVNVARYSGCLGNSCRRAEAGYLDSGRVQANIAVGQVDLLCGSGQGRPERRGRRPRHRAFRYR